MMGEKRQEVKEENRCYLCGDVNAYSSFTVSVQKHFFANGVDDSSGFVCENTAKYTKICFLCETFRKDHGAVFEWVVKVLMNAERRGVDAAGKEAVRRLMEVP